MAKLSAGVRKRTDGKFEKRFTVNGKRYSVYGSTPAQVDTKAFEMRKAIEDGNYTKNKNVTLDKYFAEWIAEKETVIKGSTLNVYGRMYRQHISPAMGKRKITEIERREIMNFRQDISKQFKAGTANKILAVLKEILNSAVGAEIISKSPAAYVSYVVSTEDSAAETIHRALTEEEQAAFMAAAKGDFYYEFMAFMLLTGMRGGEVAALQWSDIDYKKNVIHVTKTTTRDKDAKLSVGTPKTKTSIRDIPMNENIYSILGTMKDRTNILSFDNLVFPSMYGRYTNLATVNRSIISILRQLKKQGVYIEHFSCHAFRDTFATRAIEQGMQPQTLKTILGHSSLAMTMDLYAHVLPNTKQEEMSRISIAI